APAPAPTPPPPATATRRRSRFPWLLGLAALLLAGAAGIFLLIRFPGLMPAAGPTATPQVLVARPFSVGDLEIEVPYGATRDAVDRAFEAAFLALARQDCQCDAQIAPGSLVYAHGGEPRQIGIVGNRERYRASLEATLLVPER
ncbi:MAG: hypothetical protein N2378_16470, partial [Chloroflexaceae bacterium]|nr:hypothetical protein [Chloroflexaceae bacterium]